MIRQPGQVLAGSENTQLCSHGRGTNKGATKERNEDDYSIGIEA
jgi:hypothetical protein